MVRNRSFILNNSTYLPKSHKRRRADTGKLLAGMVNDTSASSGFVRRSLALVFLLTAAFVSCYFLLRAAYVAGCLSESTLYDIMPSFSVNFIVDSDEYKLERVLKNAAMKDGTVILTTLNGAWSAPNSIIDQFLESFRIGDRTHKYLKHLVIVALDEKAFSRCLDVHTHCYALGTEGVNFSDEALFMTPNYLKMMWRRIKFLTTVLEKGYNFVFTDADVMWFRDPFSRFFSDADFQIACDYYKGSSDDLTNYPNGGFNFVRSNNRSISFYNYWYAAREKYPMHHDQDVLNAIKQDPYVSALKLRMRFLDTAYFGGFCEPSRDLNQVCTMHATCCVGLANKLSDLKLMLEDWKRYSSLPHDFKKLSVSLWRVPRQCRAPINPPEETAEEPQESTEEPRDSTEDSQNGTEDSQESTEEPRESNEEPQESTEDHQESTEEPRESTENYGKAFKGRLKQLHFY